jgi:hypothetical protein
MDTAIRNRTELSLHWFASGVADDGVDGFLKTWIAIEALAMPNGTNVAQVKELLGLAYGVSPSKASSDLYVGWLVRIRGRIVHSGAIRSLHYAIPMYMEALYKDLLFEVLGLPCERFAEAVQGQKRFDLKALLSDCLV